MKKTQLFLGLLLICYHVFSQSSQSVDFRYSPRWWQSLLCLPDDPVKTVIGKEGQIFGDYGYNGPRKFSFSLLFDSKSRLQWKRQFLESPLSPIPHTAKENGDISIEETSFLEIPGNENYRIVRVDNDRIVKGWSKPLVPCDTSFKDAAENSNGYTDYGIIEFHIKVNPGSSHSIALGFCEGKWQQPGERVMRLEVEGTAEKNLDAAKEFGFQMPGVVMFQGRDEDNDGNIRVVIIANPSLGKDKTVFINGVWMFDKNATVSTSDIISGTANKIATLYAPAAKIPMPSRKYHLLISIKNNSKVNKTFSPVIRYAGVPEIKLQKQKVFIGSNTTVSASLPVESISNDSMVGFSSQAPVFSWEVQKDTCYLKAINLKTLQLKPGEEIQIAIVITRFYTDNEDDKALVAKSIEELKVARRWWLTKGPAQKVVTVPDKNIQSMIDASWRNLTQARELRNGKQAYSVGPTVYRGIYFADGAFMIEASALMNAIEEARNCIDLLAKYQLDPALSEQEVRFPKKYGLFMFTVTRYAFLTGDKNWLNAHWKILTDCMHYIDSLRNYNLKNPQAPNYGILPESAVDGGFWMSNDYSNTQWCLGGMKWAIKAAKWMDRQKDVQVWQQQYDTLYASYMKIARKDIRKDDKGNDYLPVEINNEHNYPPQKGQWSFCQSVYPGQIFDDDAEARKIAEGTMQMLHDHREEGLVFNTGWLDQGLWTYFSSFYGHAMLWLGRGNEVPQLLYDYANHASPVMTWREEQKPVGKGMEEVGDMPHNWASGEFIRMVIHMIELDRGNELHLLEAFPRQWVFPGAVTALQNVLTPFGPVDIRLAINSKGSAAQFQLNFRDKTRLPEKVVVHKETWAKGQPVEIGNVQHKIEFSILLN